MSNACFLLLILLLHSEENLGAFLTVHEVDDLGEEIFPCAFKQFLSKFIKKINSKHKDTIHVIVLVL